MTAQELFGLFGSIITLASAAFHQARFEADRLVYADVEMGCSFEGNLARVILLEHRLLMWPTPRSCSTRRSTIAASSSRGGTWSTDRGPSVRILPLADLVSASGHDVRASTMRLARRSAANARLSSSMSALVGTRSEAAKRSSTTRVDITGSSEAMISRMLATRSRAPRCAGQGVGEGSTQCRGRDSPQFGDRQTALRPIRRPRSHSSSALGGFDEYSGSTPRL